MNKKEALILSRLKKSLAATSLDDLVRAESDRSVLLVDVSGSMDDKLDSGERKIDALRQTVKTLRESNPVPVVAFGGGVDRETFQDRVAVVDNIPEPAGGTPLHSGIDFCRNITATHVILVTDGVPTSQSAAFDAAKLFGGKIDVFYIGDGDDSGARFCKRLADAAGGVCNVTELDDPKALASKIAGLLPGASLTGR